MMMQESYKIHQLNQILLKEVYQCKVARIEQLFVDSYIPEATGRLINAAASESLDSMQMVNRMAELMPLFINRMYSELKSMHKPLYDEYENLNKKLDARYENHKASAEALNDLLISAVKVKNEWESARTRLSGLSSVDVASMQDKYDALIQEIGKSEIDFKELEKQINNITK